MQRTLIVSLVFGLALMSLGCAYRPYDQDRIDYKDYFARHLRNRNLEGLGGRLDLNRASTRELRDLPTLTPNDADNILANRPYAFTRELVDRNIIEAQQYDIIEHFISACRLCPQPELIDCPCGAPPVPEKVTAKLG